ncbi:MAG: dihydropteroate synthase [Candidatus Omnitrophica bacterium]|nr:dihydropteroate synthase [Candidatus Omnitrophota bacterium]
MKKTSNIGKFQCGKYKLDLSKRTYIMGVLNVTPDSFSDGGNYFDQDKAIEYALEMVKQGADIIDIGAESTRPGSKQVADDEQILRIGHVVKILAKKLKVPISIDTSSSIVAKYCLELGASIINDVFALRKDEKLAQVIAGHKAGVILMHMDKTPLDMQINPKYKDIVGEIKTFFKQAKQRAIKSGIKQQSIMLDPGIGFGKTTEHNLKIINKLACFKKLGCGVLIGTSRKSFIGNVLNLSIPERDFGTAASIAVSIVNGANIVRVHNVRQMKQVSVLTDAIIKQGL